MKFSWTLKEERREEEEGRGPNVVRGMRRRVAFTRNLRKLRPKSTATSALCFSSCFAFSFFLQECYDVFGYWGSLLGWASDQFYDGIYIRVCSFRPDHAHINRPKQQLNWWPRRSRLIPRPLDSRTITCCRTCKTIWSTGRLFRCQNRQKSRRIGPVDGHSKGMGQRQRGIFSPVIDLIYLSNKSKSPSSN